MSEARLIEICPAQAGTGDPDPGARAKTRVPKRAGPAGGNEAKAGHRWQSELSLELATRGAPAQRRKIPIFEFGLPRRVKPGNDNVKWR